ncbi:myosin phosphatase Rho-interacting protein isoform 12-T13 [Spinachia spinachia]
MSLKENSCRKFQANIFNKSKCQNCFKPRESHLLNDEDLNQAKPVYGGWLLLAPEGTNFDNPLHRSRKWQRRFFILYEHGLLRYALDEMPSTLPQGTINMNQCCDVVDGESRTGQKNSLCVLTPDKEHFIRAECREIINGWQEALTVYPRTNKQNQKKKRKVDPPTQQGGENTNRGFSTKDMNGHPQEPGPAKVTVTSSAGGGVPVSRSSLWQEEHRWSRAAIPCSRSASCISQLSHSQPDACAATQDDGGSASTGRKARVESGYFSLEKAKSEPPPQYQPPQHLPLSSSASSSSSSSSFLGALSPRRSEVIGRFEEGPPAERMDTSTSKEPAADAPPFQRQGRSERRYLSNKHEISLDAGKDRSSPDVSSCTYANLRRAKSLDRRVTESAMTPDLLNFKKGWMTKLYDDGMWKKHWFVLTDQSLRYYKDSIAEEASEVDGEIDLSTCYDVKEFPVQRNYGFQILCKEEACTLSAMTSGIRRNWIQAIMKNVRPTIAPDVTRKNTSLKLSVLKPRSLAEEKASAHATLEPCPPAGAEPSPSPEAPESDVHRQPGNSASSPPFEPRKSRVRERRREGRSKTFDWSEFQAERTERPPKDRADTVDLSSSFSPASSRCSPSSSPSSLASSPMSPISASSAPGVHRPAAAVEAAGATHRPNSVTVTVTSALSAAPSTRECQAKMEVDRPVGGDKRDDGTSVAREEIEQRWHQVERTPLREEKQVPINTAAANSDRLPARELAALLDKELGQKQQELDRLQKQNNVLKEQLEDALGKEQSARDGYVLQSAAPPPSSTHRVPWQCLHTLSRELQGELETQKHKQDLAQQQIRTLKRSYTEAQDAVDHHEAGVQALQSKLAAAMAEILAGEQAVARMRNELRLEQRRSKEQEEEHGRGEATLRAQLKDSEDRLRDVEASLLERNQALRHLEHQQALQRDHGREVCRLQERLQEVTARLSATEEGHALKEERLRREQHGMRQSHEGERQNLCRRLAEAEAAQREMEERLLEAEQQAEALLRGRQSTGGKEVLKLREELAQKSDAVESLRESVRRLEEEKGRLTCRCQELLNQIAAADREVNKLRDRLETDEADYCTLEHSYERASQEFQKISQVLRDKEDEIRQTKEIYERLVERKEEDLKEALVKMAALGSSLEETEHKLQAKEELLCQMSPGVSEKAEPRGAEKDLKAKLVVAKDRIAELEQHLNALQLGYADLRVEKQQIPEPSKKTRLKTSASSSANGEVLLPFDDASKVDDLQDDKESQAKRPRIRFSSIQGQKYVNTEGLDASQLSGASNQDVTQDVRPREGQTASSQSSDPEKFISIIHSLEAKLLATESKLRDLTQHLEEQRRSRAEDVSKRDAEDESGCGGATRSSAADERCADALRCVESSREKVRAVLSGTDHGAQLLSLSEIEKDLFSASLYIRQGHETWEQRSACEHPNPTPGTRDGEALRLFGKTLSFEAVVLNKMASLIQTSKSDVLHPLADLLEDIENIKRGDDGCSAVVYADALTRKLMLASSLCEELVKATSDAAECKGGSASADVDTAALFHTIVGAELAFSIHSLTLCYEDEVKGLKGELTLARDHLHHREEALRTIIEASKRPDLKNVIKEITNECGFSRPTLADISPPELASYARLETAEARGLAEEIVDRHLAAETATGGAGSLRSLQDAHEHLAGELQRQAAILQACAQEIQRGDDHPGLDETTHAALGQRASRPFAGASLCMRDALVQAQVAYVACRLRALHQDDLGRCRQTGRNMGALVQQHASSVGAIRERYEASLEDERQSFSRTASALQEENRTLKSEIGKRVDQLSQQQKQLALLEDRFKKEAEELRERHVQELSRASAELALMETTSDSQRKLDVLLGDMGAMEARHEAHVRRLEEQCGERTRELQRIHKQEIQALNSQYMGNVCQCVPKQQEQPTHPRVPRSLAADEAATPMEEEEQGAGGDAELDSVLVLKDRVQELEAQMGTLRDDLDSKHPEGDVASLREKYQRDFESLKATCERGFAAMEDTHQKVVHDLQRQHQREISKLMEERERLLAEETAATIAAIEAMKNAHREELEKTHRSQLSGLNSDIDELRSQYEEELRSIHRELEVLSEQYSQKCLENAHLAQALEAERQALRQCQRENQELNAHNQELNNRLTTEISRMRSCFSGEAALSPLTQGRDVYELEVLLRIKESEIQYLKQEIHSLKDELQSALRDKKYATDKYKGIYTELSIAKAKADCDIGKLKEKLLVATEALGERAAGGAVTSGYDIMKSKSNPDFLTNERSSTSKQSRGMRSKSLKEGLTVQERMKLFEAKDSKKI